MCTNFRRTTSNGNNPSPNDVICCRGRQYWNHDGNKYYRNLIENNTKKYAQSRHKIEKSLIVMQIIDKIHDNNGRFVKRQGKGGPWIEVDEVFAKEKITQSLRDGLSSKYRSATKAKRQRRAHHDKIMNEDIDHIIRSNNNVAQQVDTFYEQVNEMNSGDSLPSDEEMMALFTQANSNILETMKKDPKLHQQFQVVADTAETESNNVETVNDHDNNNNNTSRQDNHNINNSCSDNMETTTSNISNNRRGM